MRRSLRPVFMPRRCEFSERQFEQAVNMELLADAAEPLFSAPSQRAEKILGYDVALVPALSSVWPLLGRRGAPRGWRGWQTNPPEPPFAASMFIQYKCPEALVGKKGSEVAARNALCSADALPYFRYELKRHQLDELIQLSRAAGSQAEVCYAAPAFTSASILHRFQMRRSVVSFTDFLAVPEVDAFLQTYTSLEPEPRGHVWTYSAAGSDGVICSEPAHLPSFGGEGLLMALGEDWLREPRPLTRHLLELQAVVSAWDEGLQTEGRPQDRRGRFGQMPPAYWATSSIRSMLGRHGIDWFLAMAWPSEDLQ